MLLKEFFDTSLHYHCTYEIEHCDPVGMYAKIISAVDGTFLKDIEKARKALYETFRINPGLPISLELDRLQSLMCDFEYAQEDVISEKQKMDILAKHIYGDPRSIIVAAFITAKSLSLSYEESKQKIISTCNELPPGISTMKMANMTVKDVPTRYCYSFAKGTCKNGDRCQYKHALDPKAKIIPIKASIKTDPKPGDSFKRRPPARDYSNVMLNRVHHKLVGPPRGKPYELNQRGYSAKQREQINGIFATSPEPVMTPNPPAAAFSSWGSPDMATYMASDHHDSDTTYINMMRITENELKTAGIERTPSKRQRQERIILRSPYLPRPLESGPEANIQLHNSDMELNAKVDRMYVHHYKTSPGSFICWVSKNMHTESITKTPAIPILTILGWIDHAPYLQSVSQTPSPFDASRYDLMAM
jgi:hypothetical protein